LNEVGDAELAALPMARAAPTMAAPFAAKKAVTTSWWFAAFWRPDSASAASTVSGSRFLPCKNG
jgi:hypothetical protein